MLYSVLCHLRPRKQAAAAGFWTTRRQWLRALEMGSDCRHTQVEHSTTRLAQLEVLSWKFSHTCIPARYRRSSALPFCLTGVSSALTILAAGKEKKCHGRQCQVRSVVGELDEGPTSKQQVKSGGNKQSRIVRADRGTKRGGSDSEIDRCSQVSEIGRAHV